MRLTEVERWEIQAIAEAIAPRGVSTGLEDDDVFDRGVWLMIHRRDSLDLILKVFRRRGYLVWHIGDSIVGQAFIIRKRDIPGSRAPGDVEVWLATADQL